MRTRFPLTFPLLAVLLWTASVGADDPRAVVQETVDQAISILREETASREEKMNRIEELAGQRFGFHWMSRLVLARNWKKLSEPQRADFLVEFKKHLSLTYGRRLMEFSEEKIEIADARTESNNDVTVKTRIIGGAAGADGVTLDYRLRSREGPWLVIDVIIEGVSLVSNFRSQVQEIVSEKGPDQLIEILREKNAKEAQTS
jgi:phospholipid transport system substrate-binding protein